MIALGIALGGELAMLPGCAFAQQIVADGRTQTSLVVLGNVTDIRSGTLVGGNAFNSFSKFDVYRNNVVNLHVPNGAANLLNLVNSSDPSRIDGILNAIRNGGIGGNVYIANPAGLIVGQSGAINAGALTVLTPARSVLDGFFDAAGQPSAAATSALLAGNVPLNPAGLISVQGKINASGNIRLLGGNVHNSGAILSGAVFAGAAADFSDIVNIAGFRSGSHVVVDNGNIEIVAAEDITNNGRIAADGGSGVNAGNVSLRAGRDLRLFGSAEVSAAGQGERSAGGQVTLLAERDAQLLDAARVDAGAGASGDAGNIELSAKGSVVLAGGSLQADARLGRAGAIVIDPTNLLVGSDLLRGQAGSSGGVQWSGASLTLQADDKITVGPGAVISTRQVDTSLAATPREAHQSGPSTGNSGDLTLSARQIELQDGAQLLAQADGGYLGGKVSLEAHDSAVLPTLGWASATARIDLNGATIKANEVVVRARSNVDSQFVYADGNPLDSSLNVATASAQQLAGFALTLGGVNLVVSDVAAESKVNINSGTTIEARNGVALGAESVTAAGLAKRLPSPGAQFNTPLGIGALYVRDASEASVTVASGATIKAGSLDVRAHNSASMEGAIASAQNQSENSNFVAVATAITASDVKSTAQVERGATLKVAGDVTVSATAVGSYANEVVSATGPKGRAAAAIAVSDNRSAVTASLGADVGDASRVNVIAINDVLKDSTVATAQAGGSQIDRIIESGKLKLAALTGVEQAFWNFLGFSVLKPDNQASPTPQSFRIGGAIAYNTSVHSATASIGDNARVHGGDSVAVVSRVRAEEMKIAAQAAALSTSAKGSQANDTARMAYGVGLALGSFQHHALSRVGQDASITAPRIALHSDTVIPIRDSLLFGNTESWRWTGLETIQTSLDSVANIFDVFNGVSSAKAQSDGSDGSIGLSGSVSLLDYQDSSRAIVDAGARLNQNAAASGSWSLDYQVAPEQPRYYLGVLLSTAPEVREGFRFAAPVAVQADHNATLMFQAGEFLPSGTGKKGLGASLDLVSIDNTTEAIVREGATIQRISETAAGNPGERTFSQTATGLAVDDLRVTASSTENILSVAASGGYGASYGANGSYAQMRLTGSTRALVDDEASVTARAFKLDATATPVLWSLAGGLNYSANAGVGVGVAINEVTTATRAEIADNDTLGSDGAPRSSRATIAGARIQANDLAVTAKTDGHLEAIAVTGAVANMGATNAGIFDGIKAKYETLIDFGNRLASVNVNSQSKSGAADSQAPAKPPSSLAISGAGSGAINVTAMSTTARIAGATIDQAKPAGASGENALTVRAVGNSDIVAAAGAAAITRANRPGQRTAVGMAGSLALNSTGNTTAALVENASVHEANDVTVQALSGGEQLSVALGMAVDASAGSGATQSYALFGSLSLTQAQTDDAGESKNRTLARIANTSLTGEAGASGRSLDVTAYNRSFIGTGAGSLQVTGSSSQKGASVGGAISWANIRNDVLAGIYDSPTVGGFDAVKVQAFNATEIGSGGAMVTATTGAGQSSWSGAMVVNQITNHTTAEIVRSRVSASGTIEVTAKDSGADAGLETLIDPAGERQHVVKGLDYCGETAGGATPSGNCITAVAGTVQVGRGGNVGASLAYNQIANQLTARVADSTLLVTGLSADKAIQVVADSDTSILGLGFGVGASGNKFSGAGSLSIGVIDNVVHATVEGSAGGATELTAPTILVEAQDKAVIKTLAGQVNVALKDSALGAAATYNEIGNEARASVDTASLKAAEDLRLHAREASAIESLAAAGGYAKDTGVSLSLAMSFIDNTTEARLAHASSLDPAGGGASNGVRVQAEDESTIKSLAGSVGLGQTAGAGAAFALNRIGSTTTAAIDASTIRAAASLEIAARQQATLWTIAAGVGAGNNGFAGSLAINDIGQAFAGNHANTITAELKDSTVADGTNTRVSVEAQDQSTLRSAAGAVAVGTGANAFGAAVADNNIQSEARARIGGSGLTNTGSVNVEGGNGSRIETLAAAGSGSAQGAFSGSAASNRISNKTYGEIVESTIVGTTTDVHVLAGDTAAIDALAGGAAIAGQVAAGLAISVNEIDNTTVARVSANQSGSAGYALRNLTVAATATATIRALSVGVGAGGEAGAAGSFSINSQKSDTQAYIDQAATVVAANNVGVLAESDDRISLAAGAAGIGIGAGGVGTAYTVNDIGSHTEAYIDGAAVTALASNAGDRLSVNSGDLLAGTERAVDLSQLDLASYQKLDLKASKAKTELSGLAVNASSSQHIDSIAANVGGGSYLGAAVIESVNVIDGATRAYVRNANLNGNNGGAGSGQAVNINAGNFAFSNSFVGNLAVGAAAVGFGADINAISRTTEAYAEGGSITARGGVDLRAKGSQAVSDLAVGGAIGGAGLAGTLSFVQFDNLTQAYLDGTRIQAGALGIRAFNENSLYQVGGVLAGGGNGYGGTFVVSLSDSTTRATLANTGGGDRVAAAGAVAVEADNDTTVHHVAVTVAGGGGVGVAGMASLNLLTDQTEARVDHAQIGASGARAGSIGIKANHRLDIDSKAGALGVGLGAVGVGAGASVNVVKAATTATASDSQLYATGSTGIEANSTKHLSAAAMTAGVGASAGIGGAAVVTLVGDEVKGAAASETDAGGNGTLSAIGRSTAGNHLAGLNPSHAPTGLAAADRDRIDGATQKNVRDIANGSAAGTGYRTAATTSGSGVIDSGSLSVKASDKTDTRTLVGGFGAGLGLGVGGGVGVTTVKAKVAAQVAATTRLDSTGDISINALASRDVGQTVDIVALAGGAGIVGLGAAVGYGDVVNSVTASIGGGANAGNGTVSVSAEDATTLSVAAKGAAVGAASVGIVVAEARKASTVDAAVAGASFSAGNLNVAASESGAVSAQAQSAAAGLAAAGNGAFANARDVGVVSAFSDSGVGFHLGSAALGITATAVPEVASVADGVSVSAGLNIGGSLAAARAQTTVTAFLGANNTVNAGAMTVLAQQARHGTAGSATASALAAGGGLLLGLNATASSADGASQTQASVGDNSSLNVAGSAEIRASSDSRQAANVDGYNGGIVAAGFNDAQASSDSQTLASVGNQVKVSGGALKVRAWASDDNYAEATSGSGGLVSGAAATAGTTNRSTTIAALGDGAAGRSLVVGALEVDANHLASFNTKVNSVNAAVLGASGATARNRVDRAIVQATLGSNLDISAASVDISASNRSRKNLLTDGGGNPLFNVRSASGGLFDLPAVTSQTTVANDTDVLIGSGTQITTAPAGGAGGRLAIVARNDVQLYDMVSLDSGGALPIARAEAAIYTDRNDADVTIASGARLVGSDTVRVEARTDAIADTEVQSKTYGLAGAAQGSTVSRIGTANTVTLAGARLESDENVELFAGYNNNLRADAETRLWNKTAVPMKTSPDAHGEINQNNALNIAAYQPSSGAAPTGDTAAAQIGRAAIAAVKDIRLNTGEGSHVTRGYGRGTDLYRQFIADAAKIFGADISLDITGGSVRDNSVSDIVNNGTLFAGSHYQQFLTIEADGTISRQSEGMATPVLNANVDLARDISDRIARLQALYDEYKDDKPDIANGFLADIQILNAKKDKLGVGASADFLNIQPAAAYTGYIFANGGSLTGSGELIAPGDARIEVRNASNKFLRVVGNGELPSLFISEDFGGVVAMNGVRVSSNGEINNINRSGKSASFGTILDRQTSADPVILLQNSYADPINLNALNPEIHVDGDITNARGLIKIESAGSVQVSANLLAKTIDIATQGDFIKTFTTGFTHQGGDPTLNVPNNKPGQPATVWRDVKDPLTGVVSSRLVPYTLDLYYEDLARSSYPNHAPSDPGGVPGAATVSLSYTDSVTPPVTTGSVIAGNNVFISGEKLNINGLIQSGLPDYQVSISQADANAAIAAAGGWVRLAMTENGESVQDIFRPQLRWDAANNRLELGSLAVAGGYIQLYGDVFSTGNGKLKVLDGYGRINVSNASDRDLAVNKLDTGPGVAGMIKIVDTSTKDASGKPLETTITRVGDTVSYAYGNFNGADGRTPTVSVTGSRSGFYNPRDGRRLFWMDAETWVDQYWETYHQSCLWGCGWGLGDILSADPGTRTGYDSVATRSVRPNGEWLADVPYTKGVAQPDYQMDYTKTVSTVAYNAFELDHYWTDTCVAGICVSDREHYLTKRTWDWTERGYYVHSLNASKPIAIEFSGFATGSLNVSNGANRLELQGAVRNLSGSTTLTASAIHGAETVLIQAKDLNLTASAGNIDAAGAGGMLKIDLPSGGKLAATASGSLGIEAVHGQLEIQRVQAGGLAKLKADGDLINGAAANAVAVTGGSIELISANGAIGAASPMLVDVSAAGGTLRAAAAKTIQLTEESGDMRLDQVTSLAGDVTLVAKAGSIVDANNEARVDIESRAELLAVAARAGLQGPAAAASEANTVNGYNLAKQQLYSRYWQMRHLRPDGAGGFTADAYDPAYRFHLSAADAAQLQTVHGWTAQQISFHEASETASYHSAHREFGGQGFNPAFRYDVRVADNATYQKLIAGSTWSDGEITNRIAAGIFKDTADTEALIEQANVSGRHITLRAASGGIGVEQAPRLVSTNPAAWSDDDRLALVVVDRNDVQIDSAAGQMTLRQKDDVDISLREPGSLVATASQDIYIGSEENVRVKEVSAPGKDIRIKTGAGLINAASAGTAPVTGRHFILEAGGGDLGSLATEFLVDLSGTLTARARDDLYVSNQAGDLRIEQVYAGNLAKLSSAAALVEATPNLLTDVQANKLWLTAASSIGQSDPTKLHYLDIGSDPDGWVDLTAGAGIHVYSPSRSLNLRRVSAGGELAVSAFASTITVGGNVGAGSHVALDAAESILFAGGGRLASAAGNVSLTADGGILNGNLTDDVNITGGDLRLRSAKASIGEAGKRIVTAVSGSFDLTAATGIHLEQRQGDLIGSTRTATGPTDLYVPNGSLKLSSLQGTTVDLSAGAMNLGTVIADVVKLNALQPGGGVTVGDARIGRRMAVSADNINLANVQYTGPGGPLALNLDGRGGAMARQTYVFVGSRGPVVVDRLHSDFASIQTSGPSLQFVNARIGSRAQLRNQFYTVAVDNLDRSVSSAADAQLYAPDGPFALGFASDRRFTSRGAYLVHYQPEFIVNSFSTENSVTHLVGKMLALTARGNGPALLPRQISFGGQMLAAGGVPDNGALVTMPPAAVFAVPTTEPAALEVVE